jgi:flagellar biosynthesis protein FlhF
MRLRTFTAPDMNRAMLMIRESLGDNAVIISTARDAGGKNVSVTAALEEETAEENFAAAASDWPEEYEPSFPSVSAPPSGIANYLAANNAKAQDRRQASRPYSEDRRKVEAPSVGGFRNRDQAWFLNELEQLLHFHAVPHMLFEKLMRKGRDLEISFESSERGIVKGFSEVLGRTFRFEPLMLDEKNSGERIMLIGPAGVGKTLSVAKMCAHRVADRLPIDVLTIDNKRAGGVEQLQAFADIMGLNVTVAASRSELRQCLKNCPADKPLIIDSFGTNPYSFDELKELTDYAGLNGIEPVLVLAAGMDAQEAADVVRAFTFLGLKRLLITRVDSTRRLGAMLAAAEAGNIALANMTVSGQVAGGFKALNALKLAQLLIQHKQDYQS